MLSQQSKSPKSAFSSKFGREYSIQNSSRQSHIKFVPTPNSRSKFTTEMSQCQKLSPTLFLAIRRFREARVPAKIAMGLCLNLPMSKVSFLHRTQICVKNTGFCSTKQIGTSAKLKNKDLKKQNSDKHSKILRPRKTKKFKI